MGETGTQACQAHMFLARAEDILLSPGGENLSDTSAERRIACFRARCGVVQCQPGCISQREERKARMHLWSVSPWICVAGVLQCFFSGVFDARELLCCCLPLTCAVDVESVNANAAW